MNSKRKPNAMLIELVIVILFFSISAGIILQLFVAAHDRSRQSAMDNEMTLVAEDIAERFAVSTLDADAFFLSGGWAGEADAYTRTLTLESGREVQLSVTGAQQETQAGTLDVFALVAYDGDREIMNLPVSRYLPKEATP